MELISICGLDCGKCEAYIATQANDRAALQAVAEKWAKEYGATFAVDTLYCDGCTNLTGRHVGHCGECDIRACGLEHQVENCAHCAEYPCAKTERFAAMVPEAKATLDAIRATLR